MSQKANVRSKNRLSEIFGIYTQSYQSWSITKRVIIGQFCVTCANAQRQCAHPPPLSIIDHFRGLSIVLVLPRAKLKLALVCQLFNPNSTTNQTPTAPPFRHPSSLPRPAVILAVQKILGRQRKDEHDHGSSQRGSQGYWRHICWTSITYVD